MRILVDELPKTPATCPFANEVRCVKEDETLYIVHTCKLKKGELCSLDDEVFGFCTRLVPIKALRVEE